MKQFRWISLAKFSVEAAAQAPLHRGLRGTVFEIGFGFYVGAMLGSCLRLR